MKSIVNISEAGNLAIHALAYMAGLGPDTPASATRIAADLGVSESHLAKVLQKLARSDFIKSTRGAGGGFYFDRDAGDITLLDVLLAVDGPLPGGGCLLGTPVCPAGTCKLRGLTKKVADLVTEELRNITLGDIGLTPVTDRKS